MNSVQRTLKQQTASVLGKAGVFIVLAFFFIFAAFPLVWLFISSLKTNLELQISPFTLPKVLQWSNYGNALKMANLPALFLHSIYVAFGAVFLNLLVTSLAGFVLSREQFRGRELVYTLLTAGVLVPIISFMVPYFTLITRVKLYDNLIALIIVYASINIPVSIFLVTAFMRSIPKEMEEAAVIDGCTFVQRYTKIVLPLAQTGLVTAGTFCFIYAWNEFIMALLLTSSSSSRTLQLGIRFFTSQFVTDYTSMYAAIMISIIPSIALYTILHNRIISGLTAGAVKG
ncbi:MAG: carbohydrate ABC transporter permease [Spirochaetota bacterium]